MLPMEATITNMDSSLTWHL